jgi:hypothetical protein
MLCARRWWSLKIINIFFSSPFNLYLFGLRGGRAWLAPPLLLGTSLFFPSVCCARTPLTEEAKEGAARRKKDVTLMTSHNTSRQHHP